MKGCEVLADTLTQFFQSKGIPPELIVFIISMLPIIELRGGLIAASILGIPWYIATPICILGNLLPIPFILLFIRKILEFLKRFNWLRKIIEKIEDRTTKKGKKIQKRWFIGLILFVGIPLPGTGGWTGALAADIFHIRFKYAFFAIFIGLIVASAIMLIISYFIPGLFGF